MLSLISQEMRCRAQGPGVSMGSDPELGSVTPGLHPPVVSVFKALQHREGLRACTDFGRRKIWHPTKMHHFELIYKNLDSERVHLIERCNYQVLEAKGLINF